MQSERKPQACNFDQAISNKLHSNLVTSKTTLPKQPHFMPAPSAATLLSLRTMFKDADGSVTASPNKRTPPLGDEGVIVTGARHKKLILEEYERNFGNGKDPIVTKIKGKTIEPNHSIPSSPRMKASIKKYYRVQEAHDLQRDHHRRQRVSR